MDCWTQKKRHLERFWSILAGWDWQPISLALAFSLAQSILTVHAEEYLG
jgi:hypothetical protein